MDIDIEIKLNKLAQNLETIEAGKEWFIKLLQTEQRDILSYLCFLVIQAGGVGNDVYTAIEKIKLKDTYTACKLLLLAKQKEPLGNKELMIQLTKIISLPAYEYQKSFILLVSLLGVADMRRRKKESPNSCTHWWHKDLSDRDVIMKIKANYDNP